MKYYKKLIGKKCYLSPVNPDDADTFAEWLNDIEVTKYLMVIRNSYTQMREREILEDMARKDHHYFIIDKDLNKLIGIASLHHFNMTNNTCEFGLFIGDKDYWNQGYGEDASRLILDFAFNILNIHNLMLLVFDFNIRAINCYKKIGFKEIGRRREAYRIAGKVFDVVYMDILSSEFESDCIRRYFDEDYESSIKPKKLELADK